MSMLTTPSNGRATTTPPTSTCDDHRKVPHRSHHPDWVKLAGEVRRASTCRKRHPAPGSIDLRTGHSPSPNRGRNYYPHSAIALSKLSPTDPVDGRRRRFPEP